MSTASLRLPQLLAYGAPAAPLALLGLPLYVYVPSFYTETLGFSLVGVGVVLLAARLLDVVTDPLVGIMSDRWPGRYRRKSAMALGIPLLIVGLWALFRPIADTGLATLGVAAALTYLGWTLLSVPYHAWGAELERDYHARTRLAGVRELFVLGGTLLALVLPTVLAIADDRAATLDLFARLMPWLLLPAALIAAWSVPEVAPPAVPRSGFSFSATVRSVLANPALRRLLPAYFLNGIANGIPATLFLMFVSHVLQVESAAGWLLVAYFAAGILGLPLWWRVARRYGKHRTWCGAMLFCAAVFVTVPFTIGVGDVGAFAIVCVLTGLTLGADVALPASMQADAVEADALQSRAQRTALLFGLWGMVTKLALALAVGVTFPLLALAGFDPQGGNTGASLWFLALAYGLLPVVIKLSAVALMWRFPLDAATLDRLRDSNLTRGYPDEAIQGVLVVTPVAAGRVRANAP
ncbi:MAG: MFS transporter [Thiotrichales bacterium]